MRDTRIYVLAVSTCVLFLSAVFVFLRGQDSNWDLLNYHHYAAYAMLTGRYYQDIGAANMFGFFNPIMNIWSFAANRYLPFPFNTWMILLPQLLSVPVVALIGRELGKSMGHEKVTLTEVCVLLLALAAPLWWSELGTSFFSSTTAPLVLGGLYLLLRSSSERVSSASLLMGAGALLGLAVGLKLTNAPYALSGALPVIYLSWRDGYRRIILNLSLFVLGGIAGFLPTAWWYWYLWVEWQNPVFPLYNAIFNSPYYHAWNLRDTRWVFNSGAEVLRFFYESSFGTIKTSERLFADARILMMVSLLPLFFFYKPFRALERAQATVLLFFFLSFTLWMFVFAYQRYLIPIELLFGFVIWIFVARLITGSRARFAAIALLLLPCIYMIKISDWGHMKMAFGTSPVISVEAEPQILDRPARYLVGRAVSYILPSLHPDSRFFGLESVGKTLQEIRPLLMEESALPLRVLTESKASKEIWAQLAPWNITPQSHVIKCSSVRTSLAWTTYQICDLLRREHRALDEPLSFITIDFSSAGDQGGLWNTYDSEGLSKQEQWGRWSDTDHVSIFINGCIPKGKVSLSLLAKAFGPNVDKPVRFELGGDEQVGSFSAAGTQVHLQFENSQACASELRIHIPEPTTPKSLKISEGTRRLGLYFIKAQISTGD